MKKLLLMTLLLVCGMATVSAQKEAEIKFDDVTHDFGVKKVLLDGSTIKSLANGEPATLVCTFTYTNVGDKPLVINQAVASCGCTVPEYTKEPIMPGKKGMLKVTYNGTGKFPGHYKKSITVRTNGAVELTRLYIEGVMETEGADK